MSQVVLVRVAPARTLPGASEVYPGHAESPVRSKYGWNE